jgi:chromosome segregation ATPase
MDSEHDLVALLRTRFDEVAEQAGRLRQEAAEKLGLLDRHFEEIQSEIVAVREHLDSVDGRYDRTERRFDELTGSIDRVTTQFEEFDARIGRLDNRVDQADKDRNSADEHAGATQDRLDDTADELQNLVVERISFLGKALSKIDVKIDQGLAESRDEIHSANLSMERRMTSLDNSLDDLGRRLQRLEAPQEEG